MDSDDEDDGDNEGMASIDQSSKDDPAATVASRRPLVQLLSNARRVMKAVLEIYQKTYEAATEDARELWKFVYCDAIKSVLSKKDKEDVYGQVSVTKEKLMEKVSVSDEAMVMTIVLVKIEEAIAERGNKGISDLETSTVSEDRLDEDGGSSTTTRNKRKKKGQGRGGGRKKRGVSNGDKILVTGGRSIDPELGRNVRIFQTMRSKIVKARTVLSANDDGKGWYQAISEHITLLGREERALENVLEDAGAAVGIGGIMDPLLDLCGNLESGGFDEVDFEDSEFKACPFATAALQEERMRAVAQGLRTAI